MYKKKQQDVAQGSMRATARDLLKYKWDDLKLFLTVAEAGGLRAAAAQLNVEPSAVKRRIDALELALRVTLFYREKPGATLTPDGLSILDDVRALADTCRSIERKVGWKQYKAEGAVSIATTDGLGAFWVGPRLREFQRAHPKIRINLKCGMELFDVLNTSADVVLQYVKPTQPELIIARVGRLHMLPYASRDYLETYGVPKTLEEVSRHRYVVQVASQLDENLFLNYLGASAFSEINAYQTNTSTAHYSLIVNGLGIGVLPTYLGDNTPNLVRLDFKVNHALDLYLSYRPAIGDVARVRHVIDWLKTLFDERKFPYFSDTLADAKSSPIALLTHIAAPIGPLEPISGSFTQLKAGL